MPQTPDYGASIVSLSNSLRAHYGCATYHPGLPELDAALAAHAYKNVILLVLDGFGQDVLERCLPPESFLRTHWARPISSVLLSTTVAAISSIQTGQTPAETGWLGWCQWMEEAQCVVDMFTGQRTERKGEFVRPNPAHQYLPKSSLWYEVTAAGWARGHCVQSFGKGRYRTAGHMLRKLLRICRKRGRQFVYCYSGEPDTTLHHQGESPEALAKMRKLDAACARLARRMKDTLLIVTADHGHAALTRHEAMDEHPALLDTLRCAVDLEGRCVGCRVKPGLEADFLREARAAFGEEVEILSREEAIRLRLFGNEDSDCPRLRERMPDYLLLPPAGMTIWRWARRKGEFLSTHGGAYPREMAVPLVLRSAARRKPLHRSRAVKE